MWNELFDNLWKDVICFHHFEKCQKILLIFNISSLGMNFAVRQNEKNCWKSSEFRLSNIGSEFSRNWPTLFQSMWESHSAWKFLNKKRYSKWRRVISSWFDLICLKNDLIHSWYLTRHLIVVDNFFTQISRSTPKANLLLTICPIDNLTIISFATCLELSLPIRIK